MPPPPQLQLPGSASHPQLSNPLDVSLWLDNRRLVELSDTLTITQQQEAELISCAPTHLQLAVRPVQVDHAWR